ncbi:MULTISPECIES: MFS transporter [Pseudomonas]|uniref:MFS transporter n=1 Tax=Pseudomonas monteilii SB3101 TaxID=1435058 RepID=V9V5H0_9PSED|nr:MULTISPECIES: MFS transporter [Pseudomonas]AHC84197.1 MFS transporter [Pseudomonas monteilii SB3078]AHC89568.1 MFS transporter [Pseudomonas monteilii SB3101]AHZ79036.1 transporter protein [Pseudomonas putida]KAF4561863.1 MFS transporter [Pseudomonas sp. CES]KGK27147.1 MFS transporter [Pseudomonas plecoglossicida]
MSSPLPRRTYLYFTAQSINLTTAVMSVTMAAIVGAALAPAATWSTVPYGFQFLCLMLATYPVSRLMSRIGRKRAFMLGSVPLAVSGISGYLAVQYQHFPTLVISHSALGIYIAFANFNRFAATDNLAQNLKPKALSLVVAGGVIAAVGGPALTEWLRDVGGYPLFSLCYAAFVGLAVMSLLTAACLPGDTGTASNDRAAKPAGTTAEPLSPVVAVAMAVAALGYGIMNLLMIQASMHMKHMHEDFSDVRLAIQWHVIAMFAPSFFTGAIIHKLGIRATICLGLGLLIGCTAMNMWSHSYAMMTLSLIALGLGWNLTYVGGGALLAQTLQNSPAAMQMQGKNDLAIAVFATVGAFSPSLLLGTVGWDGTNAICMALCIVLLMATAGLLQRKVSGPARAS